MEKLVEYLEQKKFTIKTIKYVLGSIRDYSNWLKARNIEIEEAKYQDVLNYIGHLQNHNYKKISINIILRHLEHYYSYKDIDNPALGHRLIGIEEKIPKLFTSEELDIIYKTYKSKEIGVYRETDKLILGLVIYQALDNKSLFNLQITDINLEKGEIRADPIARKRQERILKLEPHQILPFNNYIENIRLKYNNKLFTRPCEYADTLKSLLKYLIKRLKTQLKSENIIINSLSHLRQSRYAIWLKQYGIRQAQYLAGFKNTSSIIKYGNIDLEDLKSAIEKYHPLN